MSTRFKHYLKNIEQNLKVGNATEHTHRPALKALLEALDLSITATNEPRRIECGAPDYVVTQNELVIGYIEAKDVGKSLVETEKSDQLKRYRQSLENLVLTDYLEFRWYVDGDRRETARLAQPANGGALKTEKGGIKAVENLLHSFLDHQSQPVKTPQNLAVRMARLAHMIRDIIIEAYEQERASDLLQGWRQAFAEVLIADLDQPDKTDDFADMVAQTLAYGLFSARVMDPTPTTFTRYEAQQLIPKSNPFLRKFFARITSIELDDEPFAPFVDDLVNLLAHTDMEAVLADFGRRTRQEDPVVHFYETFLAAYDPKLRESRGVYYTPEPVVSYIVRSVDHLLKTRFGCPQGLADSTKITVPNYDPALKTKDGKMRKTTESHKVLILDPATGTGTFLYAVIDFIRQQFMGQGNAGMWPGYVRHHLLPRLFGFELLMAPYAVAHFKLSLQLEGHDLPEAQRKQWRYSFAEDERLGVYLTNALAEAHEMTGLPLFTQWVADETNAANRVKQMLPVLVVMGNPPYSVSSSNRGDWIEGLMDTYKAAVRSDRNIQPLSDDYIKFIRFSQDRIERTGYGIVGLITNHSYLFSLVHRGMRQELMKAFDEIYVLNLHGNALLGNTTPDGQVDKNVFDIRQGVSITLLIKERKNIKERGRVFHAEIWGARGDKYKYLTDHDISKTSWRALEPRKPYFFFVPKDNDSLSEYEQGIKITNMVLHSSTGVGTGRDRAFVSFDSSEVIRFAKDLADVNLKNEQITEKYDVRDTSGWNFFLRRQSLIGSDISQDIVPYQYRPFDLRYVLSFIIR